MCHRIVSSPLDDRAADPCGPSFPHELIEHGETRADQWSIARRLVDRDKQGAIPGCARAPAGAEAHAAPLPARCHKGPRRARSAVSNIPCYALNTVPGPPSR